jgi:hypothetical protein
LSVLRVYDLSVHDLNRTHNITLSSLQAAPAPAPVDDTPETVYYEGNGAPAELAISVALGFFVLFLPLTIASIGRRLWVKYKFTNKRVVVTTDSPTTKRTVEVSYNQIREVRAVNRAAGLWGDMVIFLKSGERLEIAGLEKAVELKAYIDGFIKA